MRLWLVETEPWMHAYVGWLCAVAPTDRPWFVVGAKFDTVRMSEHAAKEALKGASLTDMCFPIVNVSRVPSNWPKLHSPDPGTFGLFLVEDDATCVSCASTVPGQHTWHAHQANRHAVLKAHVPAAGVPGHVWLNVSRSLNFLSALCLTHRQKCPHQPFLDCPL